MADGLAPPGVDGSSFFAHGDRRACAGGTRRFGVWSLYDLSDLEVCEEVRFKIVSCLFTRNTSIRFSPADVLHPTPAAAFCSGGKHAHI